MQLPKLQNFHDFVLGKKGRYLAYLCIIIFTALLINSMVNSYFLILSPKTAELPRRLPQAVNIQESDFTTLAKAHLFGEYLAPQMEQNTLPKSLLNVKLVGIMLATPPQYSQVIVSLPGGRERIFSVGDTIPGEAKIFRIMDSYIIIERDNKKEVLSLPKNKLIFSNTPAALEFKHD